MMPRPAAGSGRHGDIDMPWKLWLTGGMTKSEAMQLLGTKTLGEFGAALGGLTKQAMSQWPDILNERQTNEVMGAAVRRGKICIDGVVPHDLHPDDSDGLPPKHKTKAQTA